MDYVSDCIFSSSLDELKICNSNSLSSWLTDWLPSTDICSDSLYLSLTYSDAPWITWNLTLGDLADPRWPLGDTWVTPGWPQVTPGDPRWPQMTPGWPQVTQCDPGWPLGDPLGPLGDPWLPLSHPWSPWGHPGSTRGHPGSPRGHPGSTRGHLGSPGVTQGSPRGHMVSARSPRVRLQVIPGASE